MKVTAEQIQLVRMGLEANKQFLANFVNVVKGQIGLLDESLRRAQELVEKLEMQNDNSDDPHKSDQTDQDT